MRAHRLVAALGLAAGLVAAGLLAAGLLAGLTACGLDDTEAGREARLPVVIVPGWGSEIADNYYASLIGHLRADGHPADQIHLVKYSSRGTLEQVEQELDAQLRAIFARYAAGQRFDVLTHSSGHFVGLYTLLERGHGARVRKYVGFAGIAFGWDGSVCDEYVDCGEFHKQLRPYRNAFVMAFHARHAVEIARLDKCSLFSPDDGLVSPYDAGRFADGTNLDVPKMGHLEAAYELKFYRLMRQACFGEPAPP